VVFPKRIPKRSHLPQHTALHFQLFQCPGARTFLIPKSSAVSRAHEQHTVDVCRGFLKTSTSFGNTSRMFIVRLLCERKPDLGNKVIILYRWTSAIPGAEELPSLVAETIFNGLARRGYDSWMDRHSLPVNSDLKTAVGAGLEKNKVAVICIGKGDLERCSDPADFFRWEIDTALASKTLEVVFVVHGTNDWEDLICGNSTAEKVRARKLSDLGQWGEDLLDSLRRRYVIQFKLKELDDTVGRIIKIIKSEA